MLLFFIAEPNQLSISLSGASLGIRKSVPAPLKTLLLFLLAQLLLPPAVPSGLLHWLLSQCGSSSLFRSISPPLLSLGYCLMKDTAKNSNSAFPVGTYSTVSSLTLPT